MARRPWPRRRAQPPGAPGRGPASRRPRPSSAAPPPAPPACPPSPPRPARARRHGVCASQEARARPPLHRRPARAALVHARALVRRPLTQSQPRGLRAALGSLVLHYGRRPGGCAWAAADAGLRMWGGASPRAASAARMLSHKGAAPRYSEHDALARMPLGSTALPAVRGHSGRLAGSGCTVGRR